MSRLLYITKKRIVLACACLFVIGLIHVLLKKRFKLIECITVTAMSEESGRILPTDIKASKIMKNETIDTMIVQLKKLNESFFPNYFWNMTMSQLTRHLKKKGKALFSEGNSSVLPIWPMFHGNIHQYSLYDPDDPDIEALLIDMATLPILKIGENGVGAELKLDVWFSNGGKAIMKPMKIARTQEASPDLEITDDIERHFAEIAAFHLDRVLGFYRVPPTTGRWINLTSEIKPLAPKEVKDTFYKSKAGNVCFIGKCRHYCSKKFSVCGTPDMTEVSLMAFLPKMDAIQELKSPWNPLYSQAHSRTWTRDAHYCDGVRRDETFKGKLLVDIIDASTFDFLTGNMDRHTYYFFKEFGTDSFPVLFDNGRGFGKTEHDTLSILAPLRQCCLIRKSTFLKYVKLYLSPERLSGLMEQALENDPVSPVLLRDRLNALDRRLVHILKTVGECIKTLPYHEVIVDDM